MSKHPLAFTVALFIAFCLLAGCVTTADGGRELTATGKVALQEVTAIAVRRSLATSPRAQEKAANIRAVAARLAAVPDATTVSGLKVAVEAEVDALGLNEVDRADAQSLLKFSLRCSPTISARMISTPMRS